VRLRRIGICNHIEVDPASIGQGNVPDNSLGKQTDNDLTALRIDLISKLSSTLLGPLFILFQIKFFF
jgi:hypothetical protein